MQSEKDFNLCSQQEHIEAVGITCPDCKLVYDLIKIIHCCNDPPCGRNGICNYDERVSSIASEILAMTPYNPQYSKRLISRCYKCKKIKTQMTKSRHGKCPKCKFEGNYVYSDDDKRCAACKIDNTMVNCAQDVKNINRPSESSLVNMTYLLAEPKEIIKLCFNIDSNKHLTLTAYTKQSILTDLIYHDKHNYSLTSGASMKNFSDLLISYAHIYNISWDAHDFSQCVLLQKYYDQYLDDKKYPLSLINW